MTQASEKPRPWGVKGLDAASIWLCYLAALANGKRTLDNGEEAEKTGDYDPEFVKTVLDARASGWLIGLGPKPDALI